MQLPFFDGFFLYKHEIILYNGLLGNDIQKEGCLMEAKKYFAAIYRDAMQPVMVIDEQAEIQYSNGSLSELCEAMGAKKEVLLQDQALRAAKRCMEELQGDSLSLSLPYGEISLAMVPCLYEGKKYLSLLAARKAFSLEREESLRVLRNSHDRLLKYLNDMYGVVQNMEEGSGEREALATGVRRILRMADHLYQALDREGTMDYRVPINVGAFAEQYLSQFNQISGQKVQYSASNKAYFARIMPEDLEIILGTLLSNAVRFGGEDILLRLEDRGESLALLVWDSGHGPKEPERLFEWGYRTLDKKGGKGLGYSLPMAKMLAERQGAILQYAALEFGCAFEIIMKKEEQPAAILAEWQGESLENSLSNIRVEISDL